MVVKLRFSHLCSCHHCLWMVLVWLFPVQAIAQESDTAEKFARLAVKAFDEFQSFPLVLGMTVQIESSLTQAQLDAQIQEQLDGIDTAIAVHATNADLVARLRVARNSSIPSWTAQIKANALKSVIYSWQIAGPVYGGDRHCEFRVKIGSAESYSNPVSLLARVLSPGVVESVFYDSQIRTALITRSPASSGIPDPALFGRLPIEFTEGDMETLYEFSVIEDRTPMPEDIDLLISVRKRSSDQVGEFARLGIADVQSHYVCPFVEYLDSSGRVSRQVIASDYFQLGESGPPFPEKWVSKTFEPEDGSTKHVIGVQMDRSVCRVDDQIMMVPLFLSLPNGTEISVPESNGSSFKTLTTNCDVRIAIDDLRKLESLSCIGPTKVVSPVQVTSVEARTSPLVAALTAFATLFAVLVFLGRRKRRANSSSAEVGLLLLVANVWVVGCDSSAAPVERSASVISVTPNGIEMGTVAAGQVVPFRFVVANNSKNKSHAIELRVGCGCTNVTPQTFELQPGREQEVEGDVSTHGRSGSFQSAVIICVRDGKETVKTIDLEMSATIQNSVYCLPSRVFGIIGPDGTMSGSTKLCFPSEMSGRLRCRLNGIDGSVSLQPSEDDNCLLVSISGVACSTAPEHRITIEVLLRDQPIPMLSVPVLIQ
jgi:hypothetical protein